MWRVPRVLQWRVVFVDKHGNLLAGSLISCANDVLQSDSKRGKRTHLDIVLKLILMKHIIKIGFNAVGFCPGTAHVKPYHRAASPMLLKLHYAQPLKQLAPSLKISLKRVYEHRLAETARST